MEEAPNIPIEAISRPGFYIAAINPFFRRNNKRKDKTFSTNIDSETRDRRRSTVKLESPDQVFKAACSQYQKNSHVDRRTPGHTRETIISNDPFAFSVKRKSRTNSVALSIADGLSKPDKIMNNNTEHTQVHSAQIFCGFLKDL